MEIINQVIAFYINFSIKQRVGGISKQVDKLTG